MAATHGRRNEAKRRSRQRQVVAEKLSRELSTVASGSYLLRLTFDIGDRRKCAKLACGCPLTEGSGSWLALKEIGSKAELIIVHLKGGSAQTAAMFGGYGLASNRDVFECGRRK